MTKSAIKKYTERLGFFGMLLHYIGRFMTKTEQQVIGKLTVRFGKVKKNRLVFKNRPLDAVLVAEDILFLDEDGI